MQPISYSCVCAYCLKHRASHYHMWRKRCESGHRWQFLIRKCCTVSLWDHKLFVSEFKYFWLLSVWEFGCSLGHEVWTWGFLSREGQGLKNQWSETVPTNIYECGRMRAHPAPHFRVPPELFSNYWEKELTLSLLQWTFKAGKNT